MSTNWTKIPYVFEAKYFRLLHGNDHEFIVVPVPRKNKQNGNGIYKLNTITNEWSKIMDYPPNICTSNFLYILQRQPLQRNII